MLHLRHLAREPTLSSQSLFLHSLLIHHLIVQPGSNLEQDMQMSPVLTDL